MQPRAAFGLLAVALLAGCNQPAVSLKAPAFQSSENTVRDWDDVAHRIAAEMASLGLLPAPMQPVASQPSLRPVFIHVQAPDAAFVQEVASELESNIQHSGATVTRTPMGATVVNLDVDFVRWSARDKPPGLVGTTAAALVLPGVLVAASLPMSTWVAADAGASAVFGVGVLADAVTAMTPTMNAEAIWKATIIVDDQVVMSLRDPVYVRAGDVALYAKSAELAPISGRSSAARALPVREIRYDP